MLKKLIKDERGSAFVIAVLVMLVAVILCGSFTNSIATATKMEADAARMDEAYLIAKSGMIYFKKMVVRRGLTKDQVMSMYKGKKIHGTISGYPDASFDIEIKESLGMNAYNIICTGHYGNKAKSSYKLYMEAGAGSTGPSNPRIPSSKFPDATLLIYDTSSDITLEAGIGGTTKILNDVPGGKLTITNTDKDNFDLGRIITVTDIVYAVGKNDIGTDYDGTGDGIITKGRMTFSGESCVVPGSIYCNEFDTTGSTSSLDIGGDLLVLTDFNQAGQAGVDINYGGNVKVAGDAVFNMTKQQVSIAGDLIVGGDLTININNSGMSKLNVAGGIYVKGDLIIIGDNACEIITADGIYIKNGNLYNTAGVSVSANYIGNSPSSSDGLAVNLTNYFSNGDETPDFKLYMEISELIDAPFPSDEMMGKPKTKLPESLEDGGSANVITDMPSLIANSTREEIDLGTGTMKHVYKITEDTIFDCNMGVLLGDNENQNYSTVDEDGNAVTYRQKDNIILFYADGNPSSTSNENALDIRFTTNFAWGGGGSETSKGGRIWVDDNNHNGCVRCFIDAGKSNIKVNAGTNDEDGQCWGIEPIMTPVSGDQSDGKQWVPVDFEDGEKYINYNYVPNFYFFSLSTEDAVPSGAVELVPPKNLCVPGYFLTPNLNFNFDPLSSCGFKGSGDTKVTLDNAPAIHGCVNSNNADFQASGVVIVKGYRPGDTDDVGTYNAWPYATAVKNVYGYFDSTTGEYLDISDE